MSYSVPLNYLCSHGSRQLSQARCEPTAPGACRCWWCLSLGFCSWPRLMEIELPHRLSEWEEYFRVVQPHPIRGIVFDEGVHERGWLRWQRTHRLLMISLRTASSWHWQQWSALVSLTNSSFLQSAPHKIQLLDSSGRIVNEVLASVVAINPGSVCFF